MAKRIKNKRILSAIAKRYAKSLLSLTEPQIAFDDCVNEGLLSFDEVVYIEKCIQRIADNITQQGICEDATQLVKQYFELE